MIFEESNNYVQTLAYQIPKQGKSCCGDSFYVKATDNYLICALADGLGSGEYAKESSSAISTLVEEKHGEDVEVLIDLCNKELRNKRGATVSILKIDFQTRQFTYSSVGNIRFVFRLPSGSYIYPIPILGYLSGKPQKYRTQIYSYESGSTFIMHTDGLIVPDVKGLLGNNHSAEKLSQSLSPYAKVGNDDLTYIVGQLF